MKLLAGELKDMYQGVLMETALKQQKVFAVLICVSTDYPATGDCLGSMDHSGEQGCGMCDASTKKQQISLWIGAERTRQQHLTEATKYERANSKAERQSNYSATGLRSCALLSQLDYMVPSRVQTAEFMHCVFLGLAKDLLEECKHADYLPKESFPAMEALARQLRFPREVQARPVHKLGSGTQLKADQVHSWFNINLVGNYICSQLH